MTYLQINLHQINCITLSKNRSIVIIHKFGFTAYQEFFNYSLMSTHCKMKRLIESNVKTHIANIQKKILC